MSLQVHFKSLIKKFKNLSCFKFLVKNRQTKLVGLHFFHYFIISFCPYLTQILVETSNVFKELYLILLCF